MAFCYLRVVGRGFARVILPELILDRSAGFIVFENEPERHDDDGYAQPKHPHSSLLLVFQSLETLIQRFLSHFLLITPPLKLCLIRLKSCLLLFEHGGHSLRRR